MRFVCIARPHLGSGDLVAARNRHRAGADRSEVRARIRLAHADAEKGLAARDARQEFEALLLGAVAQQQGRALPVGDPVRADRGASRQQFLGHDIAFEHAALAAAIALGPGHADPASRPEAPAERRRPVAAEIAVRDPETGGELAGNELAHLGPQGLAFGRQLDWVETKDGAHRRRTIRLVLVSLQSAGAACILPRWLSIQLFLDISRGSAMPGRASLLSP